MAELTVNVDVRGDDRLRGLSSNLGNAALGFAKFAAAGTVAVAGVGAVTANFASDLNESISKVNVVFGKNADLVKQWGKTTAQTMGLSEQAALEARGTLGNLFDAMGIGEDAAFDMSGTMVQLASDLASFNNIGTDEALEKIRAGLVGEAEPLRTLGVNISAARTEAKALELGFKKVDGQLSASAKAQANYALILEDTTNAQGDFQRTSDGMANQQRILQATFQDSMAQIGQAFVPIIERLLPVLTEGLKGFANFITSNMPAIEAVITTVFGAIGTAIGFIIDVVIPKLIEGFTWVAQNVFPLFAGSGDAIAGTVNFLANEVFPRLIEVFQMVFGWVKQNWPTISSVIGQAVGAIANVVQTLWPILVEVAKVLFPIVSTAASVLFKALDVTFKLIGGVFEVAGEVAQKMVEVITLAWTLLSTVTTAIWNGITGIIKGVLNTVIDALNGFFGFLNGISIGIPSVDVPFVGVVGGGTFDPFNLPLIPRLAEGGIIDSPTLALLGEAGREAVIPLGKQGIGETHFHSHIEVTGENPFIRNEEDLIRTQQRIAFLAGF